MFVFGLMQHGIWHQQDHSYSSHNYLAKVLWQSLRIQPICLGTWKLSISLSCTLRIPNTLLTIHCPQAPRQSVHAFKWSFQAFIFKQIEVQMSHTTWIQTCNKSSSVHTFLKGHIEASLCITDHNQNLHTLIGYWVTSYIHNLQPPFH